MAFPELLLPTIATIFMLVSVIPTYLGDHAIKKGNRRGLEINLVVTIILEAIFIAVLIVHLMLLNYKWDTNAYSSAYWVLVVTHIIFTAVMILENVYILIQALRGFYNEERHWGVEVDGLSSYFVVALWVAVYLTVYISPYLLK